MRCRDIPVMLAVLVLAADLARAENVDLSTVPARQGVQLTIYNSEDLTLVRDTRKVSFKRGANPLQFSWANTLIDPTSVELRFLTQPDKLTVLDTTFPHAKPQMLYWNVQSELEGEATIEISYFTSGIHWTADYVGIVDSAEKEMNLEGFVTISNQSGEEYEDARVRLIVGKVNLVERIAELACISVSDVSKMGRKDRQVMAERVLKEKEEQADKDGRDRLRAYLTDAKKDYAACQQPPKEIAKESLSEYFIYTIEGTETIPNGWSKRLRSIEGNRVPLKIQYRYRPAEYGDQLVRMLLVTNDKDSKLGATPLPDGAVRLFRSNGQGLSFLVSQAVKYIPIGDKIELNLGPDPEVLFELVKLRTWRDVIWMQIRGMNVFRRADLPGVQIDLNSTVAGWDEHTLFAQRVRNYTKKPIDLEVRRSFPGHVIFRSELAAKNHDYQTAQYTATVLPAEKADLLYEIVQHQGRNAKQENVTIEAAKVKR